MSLRTLFLFHALGVLLLFQGFASAHSADGHRSVAKNVIAPSDTVITKSALPEGASSPAPVGMNVESPAERLSLIDEALDWAADLHSGIIHFPIAWALLLILVEALFLLQGRTAPDIGLPLSIVTALSFLPAAATGLLHAGEMTSAAPALQEVIQFHRNLALAGAMLMTLAACLRLMLRRRPSAGLRAAYLVLLVAVVVLGLSAGHQGGIIAHQEM